MRTSLKYCALAAAIALLAGTPAGAQQQPIRIGVLQPMTGPLTKNGVENYTAMEIARDMINERGGVNGRKVELLLADIPSPTAAISETERLITTDGIKITIGSGVSPLAIAVSQTAERHGVFHWETAGAADIITKRGFKYTFQVGPAAYRYSHAAVDFTLEELTRKLGKSAADLRVALLWENRAFGKSVGDGVRAYCPAEEIKLVYDEGYDQFLTDMTPIVQRLKDVKPDVLLAISFPNDAILFQRKAKELDFNVAAIVGVSAGYSNPGSARFHRRHGQRHLRLRFRRQGEPEGARCRDRPRSPRSSSGAMTTSSSARRPATPRRASPRPGRCSPKSCPRPRPIEPAELREIALKLDLPEGSLANGSGIKFTNNDWATDPKDAGQNLRASIGVWQWQKSGNNQVFPKDLATHEIAMVPLPGWGKR